MTGRYVDQPTGIECVMGSRLDDHLVGNLAQNLLMGANGIDGGGCSDELAGGRGNDILKGGEGDDSLVGELGSDERWGNAGSDVFVVMTRDDSTPTSFDTVMDWETVD